MNIDKLITFIINGDLTLFGTRAPATGAGVARARARIAAKREANKLIPDTSRVTRQQRRFEARRGNEVLA